MKSYPKSFDVVMYKNDHMVILYIYNHPPKPLLSVYKADNMHF